MVDKKVDTLAVGFSRKATTIQATTAALEHLVAQLCANGIQQAPTDVPRLRRA